MTRLPLRSTTERMAFCDAYFRAVSAPIVSEADSYREYEVPRDVDKELTDRPYFWMWVEQTKQEVPPTVLRFAFTDEALSRENQRLHKEAFAMFKKHNQLPDDAHLESLPPMLRMMFRPPSVTLLTIGSFHLEKLYESIDARGRFACVRPKNSAERSQLVPWLMANALVSYRCDMVEQEYVSVGCCLQNGQMMERFYDMIRRIEMEALQPVEVAANCEVPPARALEKVREYLHRRAAQHPLQWAKAASDRLRKELNQINTYYQSILPDIPEAERAAVKAEQRRKERELVERTQPRIDIELKQVALICLTERKSVNTEHI